MKSRVPSSPGFQADSPIFFPQVAVGRGGGPLSRIIAERVGQAYTIVLLLTLLTYFPHMYDDGLSRLEDVLVDDGTEGVELFGRETVLMDDLHLLHNSAFARLAGT